MAWVAHPSRACQLRETQQSSVVSAGYPCSWRPFAPPFVDMFEKPEEGNTDEKELPSEALKMAVLNAQALRGIATKTYVSFATLFTSILFVRM